MLKKFCDVCEKEMPSLNSGYEIKVTEDIKPMYFDFQHLVHVGQLGSGNATIYTCSMTCSMSLANVKYDSFKSIVRLDDGVAQKNKKVMEERAEILLNHKREKFGKQDGYHSVFEVANRERIQK